MRPEPQDVLRGDLLVPGVAQDALGARIHSFFLKKKRAEWHKFESTITEWEIKHYLANS